MSNDRSRYELVSRRALLKGATLAGALLVPGLACAPSDEEVFSASTGTAPPTTGAPTTGAPTTGARATTTAPSTTARPAASTTAPSTTAPSTTAAGGGAPLPATAAMTISFSFTPSGGGRILNPYIAVWIEDDAGSLLRTVALWIRADEVKYVNHLTRWYRVDRARISAGGADTKLAISSATRIAGSYAVVWDARNDAGALVRSGSYFVCIEAARERGPYELIRQPIVLGAAPIAASFPDNGELTGASVKFVV